MKKKLVFIFGTRPEAIKIAPLVKALREFFECKVICTGQHKELLSIEMNGLFEWFEFKPDINLSVMKANQSSMQVISSILASLEGYLDGADCIIVQGDTASAFSGALAGFLKKIPVVHLEAGLRSFDLNNPFPEEMFRKAISQMTSVHLAPTQKAAENLRAENFTKEIHVIGNTVIDAIRYTLEKLEETGKDKEFLNEFNLGNKKFLLVTMHRGENTGEPYANVARALCRISEEFKNLHIIFPAHPRPALREAIEPIFQASRRISVIEPVSYLKAVWLLKNCHILLTDSGGLQEEATALGKPTLILRNTTERPEAVDSGIARLVGTDEKVVYENLFALLIDENLHKSMSKPSSAFGTGNSAKKALDIINKYII